MTDHIIMLITLFTIVRFTSQMPTHPFFPGMFLILTLAIKVITRAPTPVRVTSYLSELVSGKCLSSIFFSSMTGSICL